jgi:phospholipid-transporting ATPase
MSTDEKGALSARSATGESEPPATPRVEFTPVFWGGRHSTVAARHFTTDLVEGWRFFMLKIEGWFPWCPCFSHANADASDEPPPRRFLYVGKSHTDEEGFLKSPVIEGEEESLFCSNIISTTKYTVATFVFVNLFEQFQKVANFYFLLIAILSFTDLSPKSPVFSVAPLVFVLLVSAVKEAYEDYKRFEMDKEINNREILTYRPVADEGSKEWKFQPVIWQEVEVGDIVKVTKDHRAFPADLALLQSSTPQGLCNIETSNLDGETNLKIKQAVGPTWSIACSEDGMDYPMNPEFDFEIQSDAPNEKMDKSSWKGAMVFKKSEDLVSLGFNQLLLRGCTLRNTDWVIGSVLFTGVETKLMLNNKVRAFKRSNVDLIVDKALYVIFVSQAALCIFGAIAHSVWLNSYADNEWYQYVTADGQSQDTYAEQAALNYFTFMVLLDLFVPISLYVSMELVKFVQAWLISNDREMEHTDEDDITTKAQARTSNLNEELGQVDFIFSDKTGTLTQNKMEFIRCHVAGVRYGPGEMEKQHEYIDRVECPTGLPPFQEKTCRFIDNRLAHRRDQKEVDEFMTLLGVCHSIIPEYPDGHDGSYEGIIYQASSPDEKALVMMAKNLHYVFFDSHVQIQDIRDKQVDGYRFYVNIFGKVFEFELFHMLEFTSHRKRMSVIVRDPRDNKFKLYCKGADNVILSRLRADQKGESWSETHDSLRVFAAEGLRTLVCGYRELTEDEYYSWLCELQKAKTSFENREELVEDCFDRIERDLCLLGATAIEDRLQDGVPDTIANLAIAGISIWVLTGDKVETAINIGRSCKLLTPSMNADDKTLYVIDPDEKMSDAECMPMVEKMFDDAWSHMSELPWNCAAQGLVISGKALGYVFPHRKRDSQGRELPPTDAQALEEARLQEKVLKICRKCRAVLCCRVSPKQKSQMVLLVKHNVEGTITLAIGDGANDVPMIKAAHVGIGISGQEGLQAVMASDYAIAQFEYLQTLLLIHGAWDYRRISTLILYSFYKNITFSMTQIWFSFYSGFSGTLYYDAFSGSCYNLVFTALPVLFTAVFDRPYSKEIAKFCPELYENGPRNGSFNLKLFFYYVMEGVCHSVLLFFGTVFFIDSQTKSNGQVVGFWVSCTTMFSALVTVATCKMMLETRTWTKWTMLVFAISEFAWFVFALVWSVIPAHWGWGNSNIYQVAQVSMELPIFWFTVLFGVALCLVPEVLVRYVLRTYWPTRLNVIEELESYPELRAKFIEQIREYQNKEAQDAKQQKGVAEGREHLGFTEFQVDKESPDYIMSQSQFMMAANTKKARGIRRLFPKKSAKTT